VTHENCIGGSSVCGTGQDKIGQDYWLSSNYCAAVGTPGDDATYSEAMAAAAAAVAPQPNTSMCSQPPCIGISTCTTDTTNQDVYYDDLTDIGGPCFVWAFKTTTSKGSTTPSGYVHIDDAECDCPSSSDPTWD
jgi:hypothetical protein